MMLRLRGDRAGLPTQGRQTPSLTTSSLACSRQVRSRSLILYGGYGHDREDEAGNRCVEAEIDGELSHDHLSRMQEEHYLEELAERCRHNPRHPTIRKWGVDWEEATMNRDPRDFRVRMESRTATAKHR